MTTNQQNNEPSRRLSKRELPSVREIPLIQRAIWSAEALTGKTKYQAFHMTPEHIRAAQYGMAAVEAASQSPSSTYEEALEQPAQSSEVPLAGVMDLEEARRRVNGAFDNVA